MFRQLQVNISCADLEITSEAVLVNHGQLLYDLVYQLQ